MKKIYKNSHDYSKKAKRIKKNHAYYRKNKR